MLVYRLSKKKFSTALSGEGAAITGGRWNSRGTAIIYTSNNRALSLLEKYVHLPSGIMPRDFVMITINIPDTVDKEQVDIKTLPQDWQKDAGLKITKKIGDDFVIKNSACILQAPSAIVPGEFNYLINPDHPDFSKIKIIKTFSFPFDDRLFDQ